MTAAVESSESEMEGASRDLRGTEDIWDSSSESAAAEEDIMDMDIDHNRHSNESDKEHSESMETISPSTSPRGKHNGTKKKTGRYYSDYSYLESMSRQERRRIEGEIIKGRKAGE